MRASPLDHAYQKKRLALLHKVASQASAVWVNRDWGDRSSFTDAVRPIVQGGTEATVQLMDAYFAILAGTDAPVVLPQDYGITDFLKAYSKPFGALGAKLASGKDFRTADTETAAYVHRLAATDLQTAQVRSARDWMARSPRPVIGYQRVFDGGCDLCRIASQRLYKTGALMPIHDNCGCGIAPVFQGETLSMKFHDPASGQVEA